MTLTRKLEAAFAAYLGASIDDEELNIYPGHDRAPVDDEGESAVRYPALLVYAENSQPFGDMPPAAGIRSVSLRLEIIVDSTNEEDADRERLDDWRAAIDLAAGDVSSIQMAMNAPEDEEDDERSVTGLHVYDVLASGEPSEMNGTEWIEQFTYDIIAQNGDG
jgi:hypothetical protein